MPIINKAQKLLIYGDIFISEMQTLNKTIKSDTKMNC